MKTIMTTAIAVTGLAASFLINAKTPKEPTAAELKAEAITVVKKFAGTMKPMLQQTIQEHGLVDAIEVCATKAPDIAKQISEETGWSIHRVSLKPRNSNTAIPTDWEQQVLMTFDERQKAGEPAQKMAFAEKVEGEFRFMKAQGVEGVCLACHGEVIDPMLEKELKVHYPDDKARGYMLGDIRGAISLSKKI